MSDDSSQIDELRIMEKELNEEVRRANGVECQSKVKYTLHMKQKDKDKTRKLLSDDKKFMNAAEEVYGEFVQGYKKLRKAH